MAKVVSIGLKVFYIMCKQYYYEIVISYLLFFKRLRPTTYLSAVDLSRNTKTYLFPRNLFRWKC